MQCKEETQDLQAMSHEIFTLKVNNIKQMKNDNTSFTNKTRFVKVSEDND